MNCEWNSTKYCKRDTFYGIDEGRGKQAAMRRELKSLRTTDTHTEYLSKARYLR